MNGKIIFVNTITQLALSATNSQLQGDIPDQQMDFMGQGGGRGESLCIYPYNGLPMVGEKSKFYINASKITTHFSKKLRSMKKKF